VLPEKAKFAGSIGVGASKLLGVQKILPKFSQTYPKVVFQLLRIVFWCDLQENGLHLFFDKR